MKYRGILKKILVLFLSLLLIGGGCAYFAIKRGDENFVMDVLSLLATLIGTVFIAVELKNSAKVTCCDMLIQLNNYFHENSSIMSVYEALETEFTGKADRVSKEWSEVRDTDVACYCTFFENIYLLIRNKIAKMEDIDSLFAYRFFLFMNNARIQEQYILPTSSSYSEIFELYEIWQKYRKNCGEESLTPNVENAFSPEFLKNKMYLHDFDYNQKILKVFASEKNNIFTVKKACMANISGILQLQENVVSTVGDKTLYYPLSRCELVESMYLDRVFCVWQEGELAAFAVAVENRKSPRNLYVHLDKKYTYTQVTTFDAVAVSPAYRGNGIQRELVMFVTEDAVSDSSVKVVAATVDPKNTYSMENFKKCGFEVCKEKISVYGGLTRTLLIRAVE